MTAQNNGGAALAGAPPRDPLWRHALFAATMGLAATACDDGGDGASNGNGSTTAGPQTTDDGTVSGADSTGGGSQGATGSTGSSSSDSSSSDSSSSDSSSSDGETSECEDLNNDPTNCGFCGHDCGGAACVAGYCEPTVYEDDEIGPQDLGLTDDHLFWMDYSAAVLRCDIDGCPGGAEVFNPLPRVASLSIFDDVIYFGSFETDELFSCPTSGCGEAPTVIGTDLTDPFGAYVLGDTVYFINGPSVVSCPTTGCEGDPTIIATGMQPPVLFANNQTAAIGIQTDEDTIYWTNFGSGFDGGGVYSVSK